MSKHHLIALVILVGIVGLMAQLIFTPVQAETKPNLVVVTSVSPTEKLLSLDVQVSVSDRDNYFSIRVNETTLPGMTGNDHSWAAVKGTMEANSRWLQSSEVQTALKAQNPQLKLNWANLNSHQIMYDQATKLHLVKLTTHLATIRNYYTQTGNLDGLAEVISQYKNGYDPQTKTLLPRGVFTSNPTPST